MSTLTEYPEIEQRSPEWHALRRGMVTASTVKALLTPTLKVADNETSRAVVRALVAERFTGESEDTFMSDDMWRGVLHEPLARDRYAETYAEGQPVTETGFMTRDFKAFLIGYSPDGLVGDDGLIEIKCPRAKEHMRTIVDDEVPPQYMAQLQTALLVSGRDWIDYVSFRAGMPLWRKRVLPDESWHEAITDAALAFEKAADALTDAYLRAIEGLPATEPAPLDTVELKL